MAKVISFKAQYRTLKPNWRRYAIACVVVISALIIIGAFLPKVTGPRSVMTVGAANVRVIDGDTISFRGNTYRLVGYDTPETSKAKCDNERALGFQATARLQALISSGAITLQEVRCSCAPGTEGTRFCNYGRLCGMLRRNGRM